jgi:hypothetical protein
MLLLSLLQMLLLSLLCTLFMLHMRQGQWHIYARHQHSILVLVCFALLNQLLCGCTSLSQSCETHYSILLQLVSVLLPGSAPELPQRAGALQPVCPWWRYRQAGRLWAQPGHEAAPDAQDHQDMRHYEPHGKQQVDDTRMPAKQFILTVSP